MIHRDLETCVLDLVEQDGAWQARCCYPEDMAVLEGHFPGHPIVPGVYALELALHLLARVGKPVTPPYTVTRAKFARPIYPGKPFVLSLVVSPVTASTGAESTESPREPQQQLRAELRDTTEAAALLVKLTIRPGPAP